MGDKRLDIKTGFICNNNCHFCVQAQNKYKGNRTTEEIKKDLLESRKRCRDIVFTGGEVTIREDIFELVSYAKRLGYETIQIQSNCRVCFYIPFLQKLIQAGANEFGPAVHGHTAELHDYLTRSPDSFNQTVQAIKNLRKLNQRILTNTVVVKPNYKHLPEIAKLLVALKVDQFQFAFVHPMGNAYKHYNEMIPKMSLAAPYIHKGLQIGIDAGIRVMAEAMPYCMMKGYEEYISEKIIPNTEVKTGYNFDKNFTDTRVKEGKVKFPQCKRCKYDKICEGPWKEYPERFGDEEFKAISGQKINFVVQRKSENKINERKIDKNNPINFLKKNKFQIINFKKNGSKSNNIALFIIGKCNNRCIFCSIPEEIRKDINLPLHEIKKIIDSQKNKNVTLDFYGMEPTLHPNIIEALKYADKKGLNISLATNARLCSSDKFLDNIKNIKRMNIRSSLYGHTPELHDYLTGSNGSFKETINGFKNIIKHKIPLSINIVINKKNVFYLRKIIDLLIKIRVKEIKFSGLIICGNMRNKKNHNLIVSYAVIKKVLPNILEYLEEKRIQIFIEKLPTCMAPKFSNCFYIESDNKSYIKLDKCSKCKYYNNCTGVDRSYIRLGFPCPVYPIA